ncbi:hypothetical protein Y032_0155g3063 [Ancylostoma ceylanicum]|uniref:Uncharacterized protein n=1 Tax=Ancylostoma ceylanicum TaxID=53326 RepID=A0A016SZK0_9BILA|nr:hypothetical protein Y032_0155g3063 [Ancylostoma ceylanicum]
MPDLKYRKFCLDTAFNEWCGNVSVSPYPVRTKNDSFAEASRLSFARSSCELNSSSTTEYRPPYDFD